MREKRESQRDTEFTEALLYPSDAPQSEYLLVWEEVQAETTVSEVVGKTVVVILHFCLLF